MTTKGKILIVEDEFIEAHSLERILLRADYAICPIARSVSIALGIIEQEKPDLVMLDIHLQGNLTGIDLARTLREKNIAFVYLSANSNKQVLEEAKATKPYGFLVKPFREKDVLVMLDVALYLHQQNQELLTRSGNRQKNAATPPSPALKDLIGKSRAMAQVAELAEIAAKTDISVLIRGESGTGKELIAKDIHRLSARNNQPFVIVDCSALPANLIESLLFGHEKGAFTGADAKRIGKFDQANDGTIFLDEIGELPMDMQVKFLRVLQEREVEPIGGLRKKINTRVIAATNRNLEDEIANGRFRIDLYYRLNIFPIALPPLRERPEDIHLLATHFMELYARQTARDFTGFSANAASSLMAYQWPGNVRELENIVYRSVLLNQGPLIDKLLLPAQKTDATVKKTKTMEENERDHFLAVLEGCNWRVSGPGGAAEILNIKVSTLNSRIKKLGIKRPK
jgi:two-component system, NtrC family, response regulator HydG